MFIGTSILRFMLVNITKVTKEKRAETVAKEIVDAQDAKEVKVQKCLCPSKCRMKINFESNEPIRSRTRTFHADFKLMYLSNQSLKMTL